jgi:hypothetical protein
MFKRLIILNGMPRSGTSWLSQIIDSSPEVTYRVTPLFAYENKGRINESSSKEDWLALLRDSFKTDNEYMTVRRQRERGLFPRFGKRGGPPNVFAIKFDRFHNLMPSLLKLFEDEGIRFVFIVRHPCGAINSWLRAPREFPSDADPMENWRSGAVKKMEYGDHFGFDDWCSVTRMHVEMVERYPQNCMLMRYEALVDGAVAETRRIFDFLDLEWTDQTEDFVRASQSAQNDDPYAVYKLPDVKDHWRETLDRRIVQQIEAELIGSDLEPFLTC